MTMPSLSRSHIRERSWPFLLDVLVFAAILAVFYALVAVGRYWIGAVTPAAEISRSPSSLPLYAFYSLVRMGVAYVASLVFAIAYGYIAAYNKRLQGIMLAALDILQSIPVLSFLPGVMLAMVSLFPTRQIGIELGSIILIFTGQVWNMAFSFYASLQAIPRELIEASRIYRFGRLQRFLQLELPYGAIGLVWNSMVSVAGGWFFLMACEMFVLGKRDFRLPGLGSYLQSAASNGDTSAILWGLAVMILVIVLIDQLLWRPAIAWSDRFKFEQVESTSVPTSAGLNLLRRSPLVAAALRMAIRALQGCRPTYQSIVKTPASTIQAITTRSTNGHLSLLITNTNSKANQPLIADLSALLRQGSGTLLRFHRAVHDVFTRLFARLRRIQHTHQRSYAQSCEKPSQSAYAAIVICHFKLSSST